MDGYFTNDQLMFEQAKCVDPRSIIVEENMSLDTCGICLDELEKKGLKHDDCGHVFCSACWIGYLKQSIQEEGKSLGLECPMSNCSALLEDSFMEELKGEIITDTTICGQRKDAVVTLMLDGFGERAWTFRTVKY